MDIHKKKLDQPNPRSRPWYRQTAVLPGIAAAVLVLIFILYLTYNQKYIGGSDYYGYYAQAQLLEQGRIDLPVGLSPARYPAVAPVGYFSQGERVLPQYPPGFPLLMAMAGLLGLEFYVAPFFGILSIIFMFLIINRLTGNRWIAASLSWLWAFSPIVVYGATSMMSDLVAACFILMGFYFFITKRIPVSALLLAYSLIIRPTNLLVLLVFLPWWFKNNQRWKFALYFAVPSVLYGLYNWLVYGAPWILGYQKTSRFLSSEVFLHHLGFYSWEILVQFSPLLFLLVIYSIWKRGRESLFFVGWGFFTFIFYCFWQPGGDAWWWTRFLLPALPAFYFLAALGMEALIAQVQTRKVQKAVQRKANLPYLFPLAFILVVLVITGYYILYGISRGDLWKKDKGKIYYDVSLRLARELPAGSRVGSVDFSGSLRLYTKMESFNTLKIEALPTIRRLLMSKEPVYLLVEPWNRDQLILKEILLRYQTRPILEISEVPGLVLYQIEKRR